MWAAVGGQEWKILLLLFANCEKICCSFLLFDIRIIIVLIVIVLVVIADFPLLLLRLLNERVKFWVQAIFMHQFGTTIRHTLFAEESKVKGGKSLKLNALEA